MNRIRVLQMIDRPFLGGGQAILLSLARGLNRDKFEVSIAAQGGGPLEDEVRRLGFPFRTLPFEKKMSRGLVGAITDNLRRDPPDVLHTHGGVAGLYGRLAARRAKVRAVVHTIHGIHYLHYRHPALRAVYAALERYCSRFTNTLVLVSESDLVAAKKRRLAPESKLKLILNGVDVSRFGTEEFRAKAGESWSRLNLRPPVVGTVARLHRQKGVIYFLRAAVALRDSHPEAHMVVVGGGGLEAALRAEAKKNGLDRRLAILGERLDARELLSLFDVFVLPSLWEGLPLVLIEAAALGKPIVATDIDGNRDIIADGETGLLVPSGDPEAIASAIGRLLDDPALSVRLAGRARTEIPPRFGLDRMVRAYEEIYLAAL